MSILIERVKAPLRRALQPWLNALALWRILRDGHGYAHSVRRHEPVDAQGRELPWFTYPAIEYIDQLDLRAKTVFEFGAGNSTVFWSRRAAQVVSIEHNPQWFERVRPRLGPNCELHLIPKLEEYPGFLARREEQFDLIIVDGMRRRACCREALKKLRPGGFIILDNSDWHCLAAAVLREAGLLEVDMAGFGPIAGFATTTTFFFDRRFDFQSRHGRQPMHAIGSMPHQVDAREAD